MTDDSEDNMVSDDQTQSSEDHHASGRAMALSHPPLFPNTFKPLRFSPAEPPPAPVCCTNVVHNRPFDDGSGRCSDCEIQRPVCCTSVVHKPSSRSRSPSTRSHPHPGRRQPGLIVRGRVFYLRVRVPRALESTVGRTHLWRSLGTGDKSEAVRRARIVGHEFEMALRNRQGTVGRQIVLDRPPGSLEAPHPADVPASPEKTLRELLTVFLADPTRVRSTKTRMIYSNAMGVVGEVLGMDTPLRSIDRQGCRRLLDLLRWLPTNATKRFPTLSVVQASEMAKAKNLRSTLGCAAINSYLKCLSALLNFAINEGYIDRNPAKGLRVVDPIPRRDRRLPFSKDQLRAIFNAPLYRGCVDDAYGYAMSGDTQPRRARFWVPLIALFSGMRLNEICQLDLTDIRRVDGVDCFLVTSRSLGSGGDKKVKTGTSERYVPIHPHLVEIGFLSFVDERRHAGALKLFADLTLSGTGYYSDAFSKWFRRFLVKSHATAPRTCFHSFRHCFRDALREARIDHDVALALGGWSLGSGKENVEVAEAYGSGFQARTLHDAITRVTYPDLALDHLFPETMTSTPDSA
jgi:integrase